MQIWRHLKGLALLAATVLVVSACSSSSSSTPQQQTLSGTIAAGAPLAAGNLWIMDAKKVERGPFAIGVDGSYSADVSDLTPPLMLKARGSINGTSYDLFSTTASVGGTVNVNPLTTLIVANASKEPDLSKVYADPNAYKANLSADAVTVAQAAITELIKPLIQAAQAAGLDVSQSSNIMNGANVVGSALDKILDVTKVSAPNATTGAVTISMLDTTSGNITPVANVANISTATQAQLLTTATTSIAPQAAAVAAVSTDLDGIKVLLAKIQVISNSTTNRLNSTLMEDVFSPTFGYNDGYTRAQVINAWMVSGDQGPAVGSTLSNPYIIEYTNREDHAVRIGISYLDPAIGITQIYEDVLVRKDTDGNWRMVGNNDPVEINFEPSAAKIISSNGTLYVTGFNAWLNSYNFSTTQIAKAEITGPGLAAGQLVLQNNMMGTNFQPVGVLQWNNNAGVFNLQNSVVASIPTGAIYVIKLYDANGAVVNTITRKIAQPPIALNDPSFAGKFIDVTGSTHSASTWSNSIKSALFKVPAVWSVPSTVTNTVRYMEAFIEFGGVNGNNNQEYAWQWKSVSPLTDTAVIDLTAYSAWKSLSSGSYGVEYKDTYRRRFQTRWLLDQQ